MDDLLTNPTAARRFNPRRHQYLKNCNPDAKQVTKHEENLQRMVCQYLKLQYPQAIFRSDTSSGRWEYSRRDLGAKLIFHSQKSFPDLFIYEPRVVNGKQYAGLALELKKDGTTIVLKTGPNKGHLTSNPHIREQALMLKELRNRGYYATFGIGFDQTQRIIDWYFGKTTQENAQLF